jgi:NAD(P)-dependent dehydrogenase (short-subunit alcohol dehydrogenase family)
LSARCYLAPTDAQPAGSGAVVSGSGAYGGDVETMRKWRAGMSPMGKQGDGWDTAHAALFLASDEAKYNTGTTLTVDGGLTVRVR